MEPNSASNAAPSAGDLILQQRTQAVQQAQQAAQQGDGSLLSQLTSNPLFTAVRNPLRANFRLAITYGRLTYTFC